MGNLKVLENRRNESDNSRPRAGGGYEMKLASLISALSLWAALGCVSVFAQVTPMPGDPLTGSGVVNRTLNTYTTLMGSAQPSAPVDDTGGFGIPSTAAAPANIFEGTLNLML